ncbi:uncharacterized protein L969DRAFT_95312 [Mixia osmundae IAM 14324]|uniref:PXA domain-containing protein n=1 Tax=Mixia osmundae (strain CBS 9802 / IAM 14324 / JCM 22182 / KY 12970) TaxID=764103 RepID=G7DZ01_MIXOS|nr:uncharacterized protein L969DRAFT_95312 [Mixia osmundae IAM 14324]KEI38215.1 hypothetical protein L969DRAFT_95312 [Mixia osmundae IAM 14324]GAA95811.1 hypothetical protein E5Q_02468 [Mixia osmundae IAM 14324]
MLSDAVLYRLLWPPSASPHAQSCSQIELPPLLRNRRLGERLDRPLYNLLALILREHVLPWYGKLSRDKEFVWELRRVLVDVLREVERACSSIDLPELVYCRLPTLVDVHVRDYHEACSRRCTAYAHQAESVDQVFNTLQPHLGITSSLSTDSKLPDFVEAAYLNNVVDGMLLALLPDEESTSPAVKAIARDIIVQIILANVLARAAQPWFLYQTVIKLAQPRPKLRNTQHTLWQAFQHACTMVVVAVSFLRVQILGGRVRMSTRRYALHRPSLTLLTTMLCTQYASPVTAVSAIDAIFTLGGSATDQVLIYLLAECVFSPDQLVRWVEIATEAIFPDGHPPPPAIDPTAEQQVTLRTEAALLLGEAIPPLVTARILHDMLPAKRSAALGHGLLDPFSSHACNVHLIMLLLDSFAGTLCPTLTLPG